MKTKQALRLATLAGLCTLAAAPSIAADDTGYFYGGLGVGQARADLDQPRMASQVLGAGLTVTGLERDERDTAYKVFGGYQFTPNFGLEAGYFDLGQFGLAATTTPAGTLDGRVHVKGFNLDLVGTIPLSERFSVLGRVGAQSARSRGSYSGTGAVSVLDANPSSRETNYKVGVGLQYAFGPSFLIRGDAERYRVSDSVGGHGNVNVFSVSLVFPFGRAPTPVRRAAVASTYAAPTPAPEPALVVVVPAPVVVAVAPPAAPAVPMRVSFSSESLFSFDRSELRPEGKAALDTLSKDLQGTQFDTIQVEGHTDRLGTSAYNQALSLERAEAVKAYLVANGKQDPAKVSTSGKGETMPVTKAEDCKGQTATTQLKACLQADRRVDVEVVGQR